MKCDLKEIYYYSSPVGVLKFICEGAFLIYLRTCDELYQNCEMSPFAEMVSQQLDQYFAGVRTVFDVPLKPHGTPFQLAAWAALQTIPYGETRSYKDIAIHINKPNASRAVGMANNKNPITIIIPCHRVIGYSGKMVGYAGGLKMKEFLLNLELL